MFDLCRLESSKLPVVFPDRLHHEIRYMNLMSELYGFSNLVKDTLEVSSTVDECNQSLAASKAL